MFFAPKAQICKPDEGAETSFQSRLLWRTEPGTVATGEAELVRKPTQHTHCGVPETTSGPGAARGPGRQRPHRGGGVWPATRSPVSAGGTQTRAGGAGVRSWKAMPMAHTAGPGSWRSGPGSARATLCEQFRHTELPHQGTAGAPLMPAKGQPHEWACCRTPRLHDLGDPLLG